MISDTEYQIKNEGERYTVRVEYESVRGCFRKITQINVYSDIVIVVCDSDGRALRIRPYIYSLNSEVDLNKYQQAAVEGKQKLLHEINNETITVRDNIFDKPGIEKEIISTKELPKFRWSGWFGGKRDDR
jgi:hypothetical protein